jgi:hypothetical protein
LLLKRSNALFEFFRLQRLPAALQDRREHLPPPSGVKLPPDIASTTVPTALATSAAVWIAGRAMLTWRAST